jgi:hypothetical protein
MPQEADHKYYARRCTEERERAEEATDLKLKALHLALAARYDALARKQATGGIGRLALPGSATALYGSVRPRRRNRVAVPAGTVTIGLAPACPAEGRPQRSGAEAAHRPASRPSRVQA